MSAQGSIVYVAGQNWAGQASYHRALALARTTASTLAVLSDTNPGGPHPAVVRKALPANATLAIKVVEGGGGLPGLAWRGESRSWLRQLPCSVWLVRPDGPDRSRAVIAAVELRGEGVDPLDEAVIRTASAVAQAESAHLTAVHAWGFIGESILACPLRGVGPVRARQFLMKVQREHQGRMESLLRSVDLGMQPRWTLDKGGASEVIRHALRRTAADTVVLGYRARTGVWGFVQGNLAESLLGTPGLSVLAVRPDQPAPFLTQPAHSGESA